MDPGKQIEIDFAVYEIEANPGWGPNRFVAPSTSQFSGLIADLSVDGWAIIYKSVDHGATVELWYLVELPGWHAPRADQPGFGWM